MSFKTLTKTTQEITRKFPGKQWKPEIRTLDLVEEVGELANAILVKEKHKGKKCAKNDLADSIVDILFDLILLAKHYKLDIDQEYLKMIKDLRKRQKRKEFE